jgi:hypothetical protein
LRPPALLLTCPFHQKQEEATPIDAKFVYSISHVIEEQYEAAAAPKRDNIQI